MPTHLDPARQLARFTLAAALFFVMALAVLNESGMRFEADGLIHGFLRTFLWALALLYLLRKHDLARKSGLIVLGIFTYMLLCGGSSLLTFAAAATNYPLQDDLMVKADSLLGYDWRAYGAYVDQRPLLSWAFDFAYGSLGWQAALLIVVLSLKGDIDRLTRFYVASLVTILTAIAIFVFLPVTTAWLNGSPHDAHDAARLGMSSAWVDWLLKVRTGELRVIRWGMNGALVGFPSLHCAAGIVNTWYLWRDRPYFAFGIPLNLVMIASSLKLGGHYLIDVVGGIFLAIVAIIVVETGARARAASIAASGIFKWRLACKGAPVTGVAGA